MENQSNVAVEISALWQSLVIFPYMALPCKYTEGNAEAHSHRKPGIT